MSYEPMTTVRLLKNVPLDNSYTNQFSRTFFPTRTEQTTYFISKTAHTAADLTYQREQKYVDYPAEYDEIYECNYLMYQNNAFNANWFYAFITRVEYFSEGLTRVYFEIDSWQTFLFDVEIHPCMVEREHVNDDTAGANLIDEGLALGDFVVNAVTERYFDTWWIVAGATVDLQVGKGVVGGRFYGGTFSGVRYYCYSSASSFNAMLDRLSTEGMLDNIVTVFMLPVEVVSPNQEDGEELERNPNSSSAWNIPNSQRLDGYVPRNKKLLTYPFRYVSLSNQSGSDCVLRYEFWAVAAGELRTMGSISPNGRIWCWPQSYKGLGANLDEGISIGNYPICTWVGNTYANWVAQQQVTNAMALSGATVKAATQMALGSPSTALAGLATSAGSIALNNMLGGIEHSFTPAQARGNTAGENFLLAYNEYGFIAKEMTITSDYAKSIDGYFDAFGYKVNKLKVPNTTGRPSWNYVKTVNAQVTGNCNTEHLVNIKNMFNRGVTLWHGDWVGDYTRNNSGSGPTPEPKYYLSVVNGYGSGYYNEGTAIAINAQSAINFINWTTSAGGTFDDPNAVQTTFHMPANDVTITANYQEPTETRLDECARQFIGAVEWDDTVRLWQVWYYGSYVKDAWCTTFLTYCAAMIGKGAQVPKNAAVQSLYDAMNRLGRTWEATVGGQLPKVGDVVFFITSQSTTVLHHCGVVSAVDGNLITYISGNTGNPSGGADGVFEKTTTIGQGGSYYAKYFGRVDYT